MVILVGGYPSRLWNNDKERRRCITKVLDKYKCIDKARCCVIIIMTSSHGREFTGEDSLMAMKKILEEGVIHETGK